MSACQRVFFLLSAFFVFSLVQSTEFVPCFIWSNKRTSDRVPALNKISQDIFKEGIQKHLKDDSIDLIAIFAEQTLSPEDFAQHDQTGVIFSNLAKLAKTTKVSYLPYVQNPVKAMKHLDVAVTEVPVNKLGKGFEIPETDILIVNLNDARDNENRNDMLKRHDADIAQLYQELTKSHKNVLCIYTSRHTSWVASEEVQSRQRRSLLEIDPQQNANPAPETQETQVKVEKSETPAVKTPLIPTGNFYSGKNILLYFSDLTYTLNDTVYNVTAISFDWDETNYILNPKVTGQHNIELTMKFTHSEDDDYWQMENPVNVSITSSNITVPIEMNLTSGASIAAPYQFSFHCGDQVLSNSTFFDVKLKDFQIQVYFSGSAAGEKFDDAYDCVGFTSVPIWSGLFVTTILLIIMTIGITMMMDIRTMDKFDDAKGKTITINAE